MKLLSGSSHPALATKIAQELGCPLIERTITQFSNGETRVHIQDQVEGKRIIVVQSLSTPTDQHLIELLLLIDAIERLEAKQVYLVMPWLGYSLQDKVFRPGEPLAAKVIADLISRTKIERTILLDLHNSSIPGFFSIPTSHLSTLPLFESHCREHYNLEEIVVVSPDFGGLKRARDFATLLNVPLANIDKHRDLNTGLVDHMELHGTVVGKHAIVFDDIIMSGGTLVKAAEVLRAAGATRVTCMATHALLVDQALEAMSSALIDEVVITDSVPHDDIPSHWKVLSTAQLFAKSLRTLML